MKATIDLFQDVKAIALMRNGESVGRILARWAKNPNGAVCRALVQIRNGGDFISCEGKAGGYGYDKFSAAVASALKSVGMLPEHDYPGYYSWVFSNWNDTDEQKDARAGFADELASMASTGAVKFIPVYGGTGNVEKAFRAVGFDYVEVV